MLLSLLVLVAALSADRPPAGPAVGLVLAASVWWALHRLCASGSRRAERLALAGVLALALSPVLYTRMGLVATIAAVGALVAAFALTPRAPGMRVVRQRVPGLWLAGGALGWSALLIVAAVVLPVYGGTTSSSAGGTAEFSATLVDVNGASVLVPVSIPAALCAIACVLLHLANRHGWRSARRGAWGAAWLLALFAFVTGFTIGPLVLPAVAMLFGAAALAES